MCFTCSVTEYGDDWQSEVVDRTVEQRQLRLVPDAEETNANGAQKIVPFAQDFLRIPLVNIRDPELSVRTRHDEEELLTLGDSLVHDGMIYPIIVELVSENFYEVIIGSRRVRAARIREVDDIPALVVSPQSPLTKIIMMLAENIHRVNLDPFEEASVFLRLMREHGLNTSEVSRRVRRSTQYVTQRIQLLSLPGDVKQLVADGKLAFHNAAALARLPEKERQRKFARTSVEHRLTPGELRRKIAAETGAMEDTSRTVPYRVTPEKFAARTEEFVRWFQRATPRLALDGSTADGQKLMMSALASLENQIVRMKDVIRKGRSTNKRRTK